MYNGNNPTAKRSQEWLVQALIDAMTQMPYEQITIQEICRRAQLSRQTFYNFFNSKEEILRFWLQKVYKEQVDLFSESPDVTEIVDAIFSVLNNNKIIFMSFVRNNLEGIVADEMVKCITQYAERFVQYNKRQEKFFHHRIILLAGALAHILLFCSCENETLQEEEFEKLLTEFFSGELYEFSVRD